jgi:hypothetical protein
MDNENNTRYSAAQLFLFDYGRDLPWPTNSTEHVIDSIGRIKVWAFLLNLTRPT